MKQERAASDLSSSHGMIEAVTSILTEDAQVAEGFTKRVVDDILQAGRGEKVV